MFLYCVWLRSPSLPLWQQLFSRRLHWVTPMKRNKKGIGKKIAACVVILRYAKVMKYFCVCFGKLIGLGFPLSIPGCLATRNPEQCRWNFGLSDVHGWTAVGISEWEEWDSNFTFCLPWEQGHGSGYVKPRLGSERCGSWAVAALLPASLCSGEFRKGMCWGALCQQHRANTAWGSAEVCFEHWGGCEDVQCRPVSRAVLEGQR